ncbi:hypothetical protein [Azospirillum palustre]
MESVAHDPERGGMAIRGSLSLSPGRSPPVRTPPTDPNFKI